MDYQTIDNILKFIKEYDFLITLAVGAIIGYYVDKFKTYSKLKVTRKFFFYSLHNLNNGVKQQIKIYDVYIKQVQSDITNFHPMAININFNTSLINTVSNNDLYEILVTHANKKYKGYISDLKIYKTGIMKIESVNELNEKNYNHIHETYKNLLHKFENVIIKLQKEINGLRDEFENQLLKEEKDRTISNKDIALVGDIDDLAKRFEKGRSKKDETTIFKYMEDFISPLKSYYEYYKDYSLHGLFDECEYIFNELKTKRDIYVEFNKVDIDDLKTVNLHQEVLLNNYSKYLDKSLTIPKII